MKFKERIIPTVIIGVLFGAFILIGRSVGKTSWTFLWIYRVKHIYNIIVAAPAACLFGKWRFAGLLWIGAIRGVLPGELFGPDPEGAEFGFGHFGWAIWCGTGILFMLGGIGLEIIHTWKKRRNTDG